MNSDADDKTIIVSSPGWGNGAPPPARPPTARAASHPGGSGNALTPGTRLAEFEIVSLIGEGGFGIVYLARDISLHRNVAIKEYMPAMLASRIGMTNVEVKSERHADAFDMGLKSFINEARLLAHFDHPSLVKVFRFWEGHGTAYMAMPYYEGATLLDTLRAMREPPGEAWLRAVLEPLVDAIGALHREHCWHRDIAPDNVMLLAGSGRPVLLDFGSARRVIGDMTQALTAFLKPGYAPIEQYAEVPSLRQGPWSDVYALGALGYFAILGKTPPPAVARIVEDGFVPLARAAPPGYSAALLSTFDEALVLWPAERTRSIEAFAANLDAGDGAKRGERGERGERKRRADKAVDKVADTSQGVSTLRLLARPRTAIALAAVALTGALLVGPNPVERRGASPDTIVEPARSNAAPLSPSAPAVQHEVHESHESHESHEPAVHQTPPIRWTPLAELERIALHADASIRVRANPPSTRAIADRDRLQLTLTSSQDGYVYLFLIDANGKYQMLFPNEIDQDNAITAARPLVLPKPRWATVIGEPFGDLHVFVLVSRSRRAFDTSLLTQDSVFGVFDPARAPATLSADSASPYAGRPECGKQAPSCPDEYGIAQFKIDVVRSSR
ncbi:protein kinase domain-containing protein [Caballeronia sp. 15715]|uniref:protein kinase domain-containing protein n=1 Tax=Caballeronia sp. 15715 TaxID=3391030 RepID=UPI0039E6D727